MQLEETKKLCHMRNGKNNAMLIADRGRIRFFGHLVRMETVLVPSTEQEYVTEHREDR